MSNTPLKFLGSFVRNPRQMGAVVPSSAALAKAMVRGLDVRDGQSVVELGPGTGAFTRAILRGLPDGAEYLGIELNTRFVGHLRDRFPEASFVEGCAQDAVRHHAEREMPAVRAVLCGLPFASLPGAVQDGVVESLDELLADGGEFRTFQYVHAYRMASARRFRRRMDGVFGRGRRSPAVAMNVPPAYVLSWSRGSA
ncbi:MAG: rRNA adenine N-6-methyltransferase family protein [Planctomycetota bacterium]